MEIGGSSVLIETHVNTHMAFEKKKWYSITWKRFVCKYRKKSSVLLSLTMLKYSRNIGLHLHL